MITNTVMNTFPLGARASCFGHSAVMRKVFKTGFGQLTFLFHYRPRFAMYPCRAIRAPRDRRFTVLVFSGDIES